MYIRRVKSKRRRNLFSDNDDVDYGKVGLVSIGAIGLAESLGNKKPIQNNIESV